MSGTIQASVVKDSASATNNLTLDTGGNATVGNTLVMGSSFLRNRIINGNMAIDQRNAGAQITAANLTNDTYMVDRWLYQSSQAAKFTAQQNAASVTTAAGFPNYLGMTVASAVTVGASDYFVISQTIEGFNFADLAWGTANAKTVTLSFQVYSSLTGTFGGSLCNSGATRSYPFTYSIPTANTWTTISVTIAGDTSGTWIKATNGIGVSVRFGLGIGTTYSGTAGAWAATNYISATGAVSVVGTGSATFYITGVQFEVGTVATPFERRQYGQEFLLCQRYYESSYYPTAVPGTDSLNASVGVYAQALTTSLALSFGGVAFRAQKRTSPTIVLYSYLAASGKVSNVDVANSVGTNVTAYRTGVQGFGAITDSSAPFIVGTNYWFGWTASAEL